MFKVGKTLSGSQVSIFRRVQLFWGYVVRVKKTLLFDSDREKSRTGTRHGVLLTFRSFSRMLAIVDESEVEENSFMIRDYPTL